MKKIKYILFISIIFLLGMKNVSALSMSISKSSSSITQGNSVKITVQVSSSSYLFSVEGKVVCTGAGSKTYKISYDDMSNSVKKKSFSFNVTGSKPGTIKCSTSGIKALDMVSKNKWTTFGTQTVSITVNEPPKPVKKSSNNYLSSLSVEDALLSPKFDKETLTYTTSVDALTTKVKVNAKASDSKSKISGLGDVKVTDGTNTLKVTVTAENGSKRTYTIKLEVKELDPIYADIGDTTYTIIRKAKDMPELKDYYNLSTVKINEEDVPCYYNPSTGDNLVALKDNLGNISYYIYKNDSYTPYVAYTFNCITLRVLDKEVSNYLKSTFTYDDKEINAYQLPKYDLIKNNYSHYKEDSNYYLFYAINEGTGKENLYQYDDVEKTVQIYNNDNIYYKNVLDTYYLGIIIAIGVVVLLVIVLIIVSIKKNKIEDEIVSEVEEVKKTKKNNKKNNKKKQEKVEIIKDNE